MCRREAKDFAWEILLTSRCAQGLETMHRFPNWEMNGGVSGVPQRVWPRCVTFSANLLLLRNDHRLERCECEGGDTAC
jgi:hypothetical protein